MEKMMMLWCVCVCTSFSSPYARFTLPIALISIGTQVNSKYITKSAFLNVLLPIFAPT